MSKIYRSLAMAATLVSILASVGRSADEVPQRTENKLWMLEDGTASATAKRGEELPTLMLKRTAIAGEVISIQSDADHIAISTTSITDNDANVILTVVQPQGGAIADPNGIKSTLSVNMGTHAKLLFNGAEVAKPDAIKFKALAKTSDDTIILKFFKGTFAEVKFEPQAAPVPVVPATRPAIVLQPRELVHAIPAKDINSASIKFAKSVSTPCVHCHGTGKVMVPVVVGHQQAGAFSNPITENQEKSCPECKGRGAIRLSDAVITKNADDLVQKLINMDTQDPKAQEVLKSVHTQVTKSIIGDHPTWDLFLADAKTTMTVKNPAVGSLMIAEVKIERSETDAQGRRIFHAVLAGTKNHFRIIDPPTAVNVDKGFVLMGGKLAPPEKTGDDNSLIVQGAFLLAPDVDDHWTWWIQ